MILKKRKLIYGQQGFFFSGGFYNEAFPKSIRSQYEGIFAGLYFNTDGHRLTRIRVYHPLCWSHGGRGVSGWFLVSRRGAEAQRKEKVLIKQRVGDSRGILKGFNTD